MSVLWGKIVLKKQSGYGYGSGYGNNSGYGNGSGYGNSGYGNGSSYGDGVGFDTPKHKTRTVNLPTFTFYIDTKGEEQGGAISPGSLPRNP